MQALAKSTVVGFVATAMDLACLFVLVELVGLMPVQANLPALAVGLLMQFAGNKLWAFDDRSKDILGQGVKFLFVEAGAFALNGLLFHFLVLCTTLPYLGARLIASAAVYFLWSYPMWGRIFIKGGRA